MRRSPSSSEHAEAVSRRLATLSAELAAVWEGSTAPDLDGHTRVRPRPDDEAPVPPPVVVPVPGRHASRRMRIGGLRLGPVHLAVVAVVAAVAVGLASWWAVRDQAEVVPLDPAGALTSPEESPEPLTEVDRAEPDGSTPDPTGELIVDVAGEVRRPGIAVLPAGSRVVDALEAAGGARRGVDLTALNLARPIVDGEQILVGVAPAPGVAGGVGSTPDASPAGGSLVNLNTADEAALDTLPGVGPVTAAAILSWRDANGGFTSVDELLEVKGIGPATLEEIAPLVTI
ncbi:ComEA family DNA-binding protein [Nocardioides hwasunensis]|uniref:ComEA family DNA-binding protein n=1 Tax=Nocardioides hwasunensis TaxID=397258 RepID=A0ABR8MJ76_9ACTN|nr:ComEA family DNA-binding protein [Nocardioides hwasunensis]MBD3916107.1 ComEA family DNA-binding protein [Nocardioides hwasunensis]